MVLRIGIASHSIVYKLWHSESCIGVIVNEYRRTQRTCRVLHVCRTPWVYASANSVLAATAIQCSHSHLTPDIYFRLHLLHAYSIHATYTRHIHAHQPLSHRLQGVASISSTRSSTRDLQLRANEMSLLRKIETPRDVSKILGQSYLLRLKRKIRRG